MSKELIPNKLSNLYALFIDQRRFAELGSIMWDDFSMLGQFEIKGIGNFIGAMKQLENYKSTMHQIMNVHGKWSDDCYEGVTYCIASHIFDFEGIPNKLDMGIIYQDVIEIRGDEAKFISRTFNLQWQKTDPLDIPE